VDGFPGLRQQVHDEDGRLAVITTVDADRSMVLILIFGEDTTAGAAELVGIVDTIRLTR
jgi:hypothetical protein